MLTVKYNQEYATGSPAKLRASATALASRVLFESKLISSSLPATIFVLLSTVTVLLFVTFSVFLDFGTVTKPLPVDSIFCLNLDFVPAFTMTSFDARISAF